MSKTEEIRDALGVRVDGPSYFDPAYDLSKGTHPPVPVAWSDDECSAIAFEVAPMMGRGTIQIIDNSGDEAWSAVFHIEALEMLIAAIKEKA